MFRRKKKDSIEVTTERCTCCGSYISLLGDGKNYHNEAIRPSHPDATGALKNARVCVTCLQRMNHNFGEFDGYAYLRIPTSLIPRVKDFVLLAMADDVNGKRQLQPVQQPTINTPAPPQIDLSDAIAEIVANGGTMAWSELRQRIKGNLSDILSALYHQQGITIKPLEDDLIVMRR